VYLAYTPAGSSTPAMELELPPKSVEIIIQQLQEHANQARFVNGERMLEYPKPYPVVPPGTSRRKRKVPRRKKAIGQPSASPEGGPAAPVGNSGVAEGLPPAS
jgi:hypothetical protein